MHRSKLGLHHLKMLALGLTLAVFSVTIYVPQAAAGTASESQARTTNTNTTTNIDEPGPATMAFDGLVVRPVSLAGSILGTAAFVVTLPFSAIGGNVGQAGHALVVEPFAFTFARPLGHYDEGDSSN